MLPGIRGAHFCCISLCYTQIILLCFGPPRPRDLMAARALQVTCLSGEQLVIDCADGATVWDVMSTVRREWGVPKREQTLCADAEVLAPRHRLGDGDVCLTLVRMRPSCARCRRQRSRPLSLCGQCLAVQYCSSACQRADWRAHRSHCRATCQAEGERADQEDGEL